jgi:hypothetical protein
LTTNRIKKSPLHSLSGPLLGLKGLRLALLLGLVLVAAVSIAAGCESRFAGGTDDFTEERLETSIVIGQSDADYSMTLTALAAYMAEHAFGFQVEVVQLTGSEVQSALENGRVDVVMNVGQFANNDWFVTSRTAGTIVNTGPSYYDGDFPVSGAVTPRLAEVGPDFVAALKAMEVRLDRLEETDTWWHENDIDGEFRAAVYYFWNFNFEEGWKAWMKWNPAERIRQHIQRFAKVRYPDLYEGYEYDEHFDRIFYDENGDAIPNFPEEE